MTPVFLHYKFLYLPGILIFLKGARASTNLIKHFLILPSNEKKKDEPTIA